MGWHRGPWQAQFSGGKLHNPEWFEPYDKVKDSNPDARAAGAALIKDGVSTGAKRKTFIYVNNRLEGNALDTIAAMLAESE